MISFEQPYLVGLVFIAFLFAIGFGVGAMFTEERFLPATSGEPIKAFRWFMLIVPCIVGVTLILVWPSFMPWGAP